MAINLDLIGGAIGFLLTLMALSYLIGDNPLFRIAVYLFVGVAAGYAAAVALWQVLYGRIVVPLILGPNDQRIFALVALVLGILLLTKISPKLGKLGTPVVAYLVAVAAAVAIGGTVMGTLIPQVQAAANLNAGSGASLLEQILFGLLMLAGTITTLVYFHFGARATATGPQRNKVVTILAGIGKVFIAITLGVLFAGVFSASLAALVGRISGLLGFLAKFRL